MGRWTKTSKSKMIVILSMDNNKKTKKSQYIHRACPPRFLPFFLACFGYLLSSVDNVAQKVRHSNHSTGLEAPVLHLGYKLCSEHGVDEVLPVAQGNAEALCASS